MSYKNTDAWRYISKRWGSWLKENGAVHISAICGVIAHYFECYCDEFQSIEEGIMWCQEVWPMILPLVETMVIYDPNGWEIDDSKDKESLKHENLPPSAPGGQITHQIIPELEEIIKITKENWKRDNNDSGDESDNE